MACAENDPEDDCVVLLTAYAERFGSPNEMVLPVMDILKAPVATRLEIAGTEKSMRCPVLLAIVIAPPAALNNAVPEVYVVCEFARAIPPPPPGAAADRLNVKPFDADAVVPLKFVSASVGFP